MLSLQDKIIDITVALEPHQWSNGSSSVVDRWFEPRFGKTKENKISICCFFRFKE